MMDLFDLVQTIPLPRIRMPATEAFRADLITARQPAIVTDIAEQIPFFQNLTFDYFVDRIKTINVQKPAKDGVYHYLGFERVGITEFVNDLRDERRFYSFEPLIGPKAEHRPPAAFHEIPDFIPRGSLRSSNLWIGAGDNRSLLHFDTDESFLMMTDGRKRCLLFAPDQTPSMYPYSVLDLNAIREGRILDSQVNAADPDLSRHPRIRNAQGMYGEIQAGEALFIPAGYWHYIESYDLNVAVNYFWQDTSARRWLQRPLRDYILKRPIIAANATQKQARRVSSMFLKRVLLRA
jgi:hypothetical protein